MPGVSRRTKIVSIRLSHQEYDQLQRLCVSRGVDSISELTRAAMKLLIFQPNGNVNGDIASRVNEIHGRVSALDRELARLSTHLGLPRLEETL